MKQTYSVRRPIKDHSPQGTCDSVRVINVLELQLSVRYVGPALAHGGSLARDKVIGCLLYVRARTTKVTYNNGEPILQCKEFDLAGNVHEKRAPEVGGEERGEEGAQ